MMKNASNVFERNQEKKKQREQLIAAQKELEQRDDNVASKRENHSGDLFTNDMSIVAEENNVHQYGIQQRAQIFFINFLKKYHQL